MMEEAVQGKGSPHNLRLALKSDVAKAAPDASESIIDEIVNSTIGELVNDLNRDQAASVKELTRRAYREAWSEAELADRINAVVGLDDRRFRAVEGFRQGLIDQGVPRGEARRRAKVHASKLRRERAGVIARTELARITSEAKRRTWEQLRDGGLIDQYTVRIWHLAKDERTCKVCRPMNGKRAAIGRNYTTGHRGPPAHPNCRCWETLERGGVVIEKDGRRGRDGDGDGIYNERKLNSRMMQLLKKIVTERDGIGGATQAEAKPLVDRGLIERISGKGYGAGNTPLWRATAKGRTMIYGDQGEPVSVNVTMGKRVIGTLIEDTGTHYRVRKPDGSVMTIPHKLGEISKEARDGDGDGWIDDGLPTMRPDLAALNVAGAADFGRLMSATWRDHRKQQESVKVFDRLADDQDVWLYHGTTQEWADELVKVPMVGPPQDREKKLTNVGGLYVAPTYADAANYGDVVVMFRVPKYAIHDPDGRDDVGRALMHSAGGAIVKTSTALSQIAIVTEQPLDKSFRYRSLVRNR